MIPGLDGLRAIAYLLVFFFHARYLGVGWVGVQFFFVLSGFLITGILIDMKKSLPTGAYFIKFYGRRFLRIFPLYYFYLIAAGGLTTWLISLKYRPSYMETFGEQAKYAYFYIYNFMSVTVIKDPSFLLEHFWSLAVEEQFYIFWPLVLLFIPEKHYKKLFLGLIVLGPTFRVGMFILQSQGVLPFFTHTTPEAISPLPFTHTDAFAFGAYISRYRIPKAKIQFVVTLVLLPILGFSTQYLSTGEAGNLSTLGYPAFMPNMYQFIWGYSLLAYFFALVIQLVVQNNLFVRILEWPPLRYMGKISYGLYVYHQPMIWFSADIQQLGIVEDNLVKPVTTIVAFFGTLLIAAMSYHLLEKPLLNLKDRFFSLKT